MSETVLFGKVKDPELIVLNFRDQLLCIMGGKRECGEEIEGSREDPGVEGKLRFREEGTGDGT